MPRCSKCGYILVLLEKRRRYKCAKCSSIYSQRYVEDLNFKNWNRRRRESDRESLKVRKNRYSKTPEEKKLKAKEWRIKNIDRVKAYGRKHYEKNKAKLLVQKKIYRLVSKEKQNLWRRGYRAKNMERTRLIARINYWRQEQKKLALKLLENEIQ